MYSSSNDPLLDDSRPRGADKKYVGELQKKLEEKYLEAQRTKEKQLADSEKKRVRKLVMEGVIESEDRRKAKSCEKQEEWKEFWPKNPNKTLEEYEEERRRAEEQRLHQEQLEAEEERRQQEEEERKRAEEEAEQQRQEEEERRRQLQEEQQAAGRYARAESARIRELREEENLDQLYQKASELVYIMAPVKAKAK